jgi:hypothetical protein
MAVSKLLKRAEENTTVSRRANGENKTLKQGTPLDPTSKHNVRAPQTVGMNKGVTKNMDNYESLRVDVWLSDTVAENETPQEAIQRIESIIDQALEQAILNCIEE